MTLQDRARLRRLAIAGVVGFVAGFLPWGEIPVRVRAVDGGVETVMARVTAWGSEVWPHRVGLPNWTVPLSGLVVAALVLAMLGRFFAVARGPLMIVAMYGGLHATAFLAYLVVKGAVGAGVLVAFCVFLFMQLVAWGIGREV